MRWAKVPIAWCESEVVSDPVRVWLAISDRLRGLKRAKIGTESLIRATKLPEVRVAGGLRALEELGAISYAEGWLEIKPTILRARMRVENSPLSIDKVEEPSEKQGNKNLVGNSTRMRVEDTFVERNRVAKIRGEAIAWINAYFADPGWYKPARKKRFWEKLQTMFEDQYAPGPLRAEVVALLRDRAEREYKRDEKNRREAMGAGVNRDNARPRGGSG